MLDEAVSQHSGGSFGGVALPPAATAEDVAEHAVTNLLAGGDLKLADRMS